MVNQTGNQIIELDNLTMSASDKVVIDTQTRTVTLNDADVYDLLSEDSSFMTILPGENIMALNSDTTSDAGTAKIKFKQGFITI